MSDSRRVGREAISGGLVAVVVGRAPGVKVDGANIGFIVCLGWMRWCGGALTTNLVEGFASKAHHM